jgi:hypothetical protein
VQNKNITRDHTATRSFALAFHPVNSGSDNSRPMYITALLHFKSPLTHTQHNTAHASEPIHIISSFIEQYLTTPLPLPLPPSTLSLRNRFQRPLKRLHQLPRLLEPNTKPDQIRLDTPLRTLHIVSFPPTQHKNKKLTHPIQLSIMRQNDIRRAERKIRA